MSVKRVMSTEMEYAVQSVLSSGSNPTQASKAQDGRTDPVALSFAVVQGASKAGQHTTVKWDYRSEDPVRDARGGRLNRAFARADMLTDEQPTHITNVIAANGGRIYVDHAHPEYSAPETIDPFEALAYAQAGDRIMAQAAALAENSGNVRLYRNNVDAKGATWGFHENYCMLRSVPFSKVSKLLTLHLATRIIYTGTGRVGIGEHSEQAGFQLSQRADYIHERIGLQTTFNRPLINTRDEPHANEAYRRVHLITADAGRMQVPFVLTLGTTSMLLWLLEQAERDNSFAELIESLQAFELQNPVAALHTVSHDLTLSTPLPLANGGSATAFQIQLQLLQTVIAAGALAYGTDSVGIVQWPDKATVQIMSLWQQALVDVAQVRHASTEQRLTMSVQASRLEWLYKWQLCQRALQRLSRAQSAQQGLNQENQAQQEAVNGETFWSHPRVQAIDIAWAELGYQHPVLWDKLSATCEKVIEESEIWTAMTHGSEQTRSWLRSYILQRFTKDIVAVSWTQICVRSARIFDSMAHPALRVITLNNPYSGTKQQYEQVLQSARSIDEVCDLLDSKV